MKQRLLETVGRTVRLKVLNILKRTQGLCVDDLAAKLGMSYMGVKEVCIELEKRGLLDTWREPSPRGRPRMLYRLTDRAHELFPTTSNAMTLALLDVARQLHGPAAPEKMLMLFFQRESARLGEKVRGDSPAARAASLAKLRDAEGHMSEAETAPDGSLQITEHHSPILDLLRAYPLVARLEAELFTRVLGVAVVREEQTASGLYCCTFRLGSR